MAGNPQVAQGTLNRVRGSVIVSAYPALNVTAPYLGQGGISLAFNGTATDVLPQMTGTVNSPHPYQAVTLTINLLKTQILAAQYEAQLLLTSILGDVTVKPDAATLGTYSLLNCSIENIGGLTFAGTDAGYVVTISGYRLINNNLFNLA